MVGDGKKQYLTPPGCARGVWFWDGVSGMGETSVVKSPP